MGGSSFATEDYIKFILDLYENGKLPPWGNEYKEDGRMIGTVDFVNLADKPPDSGNRLCAIKLINFGFNNMDLVRIHANCLVENAWSERVMEKA